MRSHFSAKRQKGRKMKTNPRGDDDDGGGGAKAEAAAAAAEEGAAAAAGGGSVATSVAKKRLLPMELRVSAPLDSLFIRPCC